MSKTDELLDNAKRYAEAFDNGDLPLPRGSIRMRSLGYKRAAPT